MNAMLFVLLIGGLVLYRRTIRQAARFATISGKGYKPAQIRLGRWRGAAVGFVGLYFVLAVLLPFVALLWASLIPYFAGFSLAMLQRVIVCRLCRSLRQSATARSRRSMRC